MIKVLGITPVYNRIELTVECLKSLFSANLDGIELNIVVVDDGSSDGTARVLANEFPKVKVLNGDGNLWYTGGMNLGLEYALTQETDYILGFNNDSTFDPEFLQKMIATAAGIERSVIGAVLRNWDDQERIFQVSPEWRVSWGGWRHWFDQTIQTIPNKPWEVDLIVGNCVLFPYLAVKEAGLMDSAKFVHFGDAEYTPRMRKLGWRLIIEPSAHVFCKPNTPPRSFKKSGFFDILHALFIDKYHPQNLLKRYRTTRTGAPNAVAASLAVIVFFVLTILGRSPEMITGAHEIPLSERYKGRVIDEF